MESFQVLRHPADALNPGPTAEDHSSGVSPALQVALKRFWRPSTRAESRAPSLGGPC